MFTLTDEQATKIQQWIAGHPRLYSGAVGGRYQYIFTPTSIGVCVEVRDQMTQESLNVTDYDSW